MKDLLIAVVSGLVESPEEISVDVAEPAEDGTIVYTLYVAESDKGRVIGKQGRIAKAIRTVMRSAGTRVGQKITVDIN
ncbi:MAG: KH domain-containing protein [Ruminococcaceae bacterium]|nr:KH domain-containing protein [Oscillospiraceae bacterium]